MSPDPHYLKVMAVPWYAVVNDLIGGWAVSTVDAPLSDNSGLDIADFVSEDVARHIAALHNAWLGGLLTLTQEIK